MYTSFGTYVRAFDHNASPAEAAGHYKNTTATLIAKGVVGFLTAGIGLGIICLIEHYTNVVPKIREFARNSKSIYDAIDNRDASDVIHVDLEDHRTLTMKQIATHTFGGTVYDVEFSMPGAEPVILERVTFALIAARLRKDYQNNPDLYGHVYGPVADLASKFLIGEGSQLSNRGPKPVMDRIKNKLFVHRAPTSKPALMALLADAFFHVTGIPLGDDEEAHMPQEKVDGMTWQTISPRQFNEIFTRVVTESGLPDEPIDIGRPDGSPLPSAPPTTKDSLRTTHYKPAPGTNPYDDVAAQLSGLARSGNPVYREILGRGDSPTVVIPLNGGRTLRLEQLTRLCTEDVMYHMRMTTDEQSQVLKETSFDWILSRLREDYEAHPENYRDMQDVPAFPISSLLKTATPLPNGSEAVLEKIRNALFLTPVPQSAAVLAETLSDTYLSVTGLASLTDDLLVNLPIGKRDLGAAGHLISPLAFTNLFQRAIDDTYSSDPQGVQWTVSQDVQDAEQVAPSRQ